MASRIVSKLKSSLRVNGHTMTLSRYSIVKQVTQKTSSVLKISWLCGSHLGQLGSVCFNDGRVARKKQVQEKRIKDMIVTPQILAKRQEFGSSSDRNIRSAMEIRMEISDSR